MNKQVKSHGLRLIAVAVSTALLAGCGGGGGGPVTPSTSVSATLGSVKGGNLSVYNSASYQQGLPSGLLDGPKAVTGSEYVGFTSPGLNSPAVAELNMPAGSSFFDESKSTDQNIDNAASGIVLHGVNPAPNGAKWSISPLTEMAYRYMQPYLPSLGAGQIGAINAAFANALQPLLGGNLLAPANIISSSDQFKSLGNTPADGQAISAAALSYLGFSASSSLPPSLNALRMFADDASDGTIDGRGKNGVITDLTYDPANFVTTYRQAMVNALVSTGNSGLINQVGNENLSRFIIRSLSCDSADFSNYVAAHPGTVTFNTSSVAGGFMSGQPVTATLGGTTPFTLAFDLNGQVFNLNQSNAFTCEKYSDGSGILRYVADQSGQKYNIELTFPDASGSPGAAGANANSGEPFGVRVYSSNSKGDMTGGINGDTAPGANNMPATGPGGAGGGSSSGGTSSGGTSSGGTSSGGTSSGGTSSGGTSSGGTSSGGTSSGGTSSGGTSSGGTSSGGTSSGGTSSGGTSSGGTSSGGTSSGGTSSGGTSSGGSTTASIGEAYCGDATMKPLINTASNPSQFSTSTSKGGLCLLCSISNPGFAIDENNISSAVFNLALGVAGSETLKISSNAPVTYTSASPKLRVVIPGNTSSLAANVLGGITVTTYSGGQQVNTETTTSLLQTLQLLGLNVSSASAVDLPLTGSFDRVDITVNGLVSAGVTLPVSSVCVSQ